MKKKKSSDSDFTFIDSNGEEQPCYQGVHLKKKLKLTTDNKLTILLALWILDKVVMVILLFMFKGG